MTDLAAPLILAINPGGTSTKIAVYRGEEPVFSDTITHLPDQIAQFRETWQQHDFRKKMVLDKLTEHGIAIRHLSAVVGRGGLVRPIEGGTYRVSEAMVRDLAAGVSGQHVCNLAGAIAYEIGKEYGIPAFIVDPPIVDELEEVARLSGTPLIARRSIFHALNHRAVAHKVAQEMGRKYSELNLVIVHGGSGISVAAHRRGRAVDANNALDGTGPFSPERAGTLPVTGLIKLAYSGGYTEKDLIFRITRNSGLMCYLGTNDGREILRRIEAGDEKARFYLKAMCYTVSKEVGRMAAVLGGSVDAIILTAGLAYNRYFVDYVTERVQWIAPVIVKPGENEMEALALGALRALRGEEKVKEYV